MGYGVALQTGYKYAVKMNYDLLLQMDGDGQHDPKAIPELFKKIESNACDTLIGSRFLVGGNYRAGMLLLILAQKKGYRIKEIPVAMVTNPFGRSMHKGVFTISYYFFRVLLSIFITLMREKSYYSLKELDK